MLAVLSFGVVALAQADHTLFAHQIRSSGELAVLAGRGGVIGVIGDLVLTTMSSGAAFSFETAGDVCLVSAPKSAMTTLALPSRVLYSTNNSNTSTVRAVVAGCTKLDLGVSEQESIGCYRFVLLFAGPLLSGGGSRGSRVSRWPVLCKPRCCLCLRTLCTLSQTCRMHSLLNFNGTCD